MAFYFYCPNCGKEEIMTEVPRGPIVVNCRDGYGMPIRHYECPQCHNLDAGFMRQRDSSEVEKEYYHHIIKMYQNIRGFKESE